MAKTYPRNNITMTDFVRRHKAWLSRQTDTKGQNCHYRHDIHPYTSVAT